MEKKKEKYRLGGAGKIGILVTSFVVSSAMKVPIPVSGSLEAIFACCIFGRRRQSREETIANEQFENADRNIRSPHY